MNLNKRENASSRNNEELKKALTEMGKGCKIQANTIRKLNKEINRLELKLIDKDNEINKLRNVIATLKWG